jgi:hypothetical protein
MYEYPMPELSVFWSDEGERKATVFKDKYHYGVRMEEKVYGQLQHRETRLMEGHNEYYAEDCAENFVKYVGEFKKS